MTLTDTGPNLGLRHTLAQLLGIAAGFAIQTLALCAGLGMTLMRWPELQGALQGIAAGAAAYLLWQLLGGRGVMPGAAGEPGFWEAAARQFLHPRAWLLAATAAVLILPVALEPALMAGYTGAI